MCALLDINVFEWLCGLDTPLGVGNVNPMHSTDLLNDSGHTSLCLCFPHSAFVHLV